VITSKRDKAAALKLLKRIMKKYGRPRKIVTDGLRAYSGAIKEVGNVDRQEVCSGLNNRAENSHQPFRRERAMQRTRSMKGCKNSVQFMLRSTTISIKSAISRHSPGLQTKAGRRVGRVARCHGLMAARVWAGSAICGRLAVTLTKPTCNRMGVVAFKHKTGSLPGQDHTVTYWHDPTISAQFRLSLLGRPQAAHLRGRCRYQCVRVCAGPTALR
jgi:DDE domain